MRRVLPGVLTIAVIGSRGAPSVSAAQSSVQDSVTGSAWGTNPPAGGEES
jgi:hypothetical protein